MAYAAAAAATTPVVTATLDSRTGLYERAGYTIVVGEQEHVHLVLGADLLRGFAFFHRRNR